MMDNKRKLYSSIVALIIFAIFVIGTFSYAFFTTKVLSTGTLNVIANMNGGSGGVFIASGIEDFHFNIDATNFSSDLSEIASSSSQYSVSFIGSEATCTYDLNFINNGYYDNELKLRIYDNENLVVEDYIQNLNSISQSLVSNSDAGIKKSYIVDAYLYNLNGVNQEHLYSNHPTIEINISNVECGDNNE